MLQGCPAFYLKFELALFFLHNYSSLLDESHVLAVICVSLAVVSHVSRPMSHVQISIHPLFSFQRPLVSVALIGATYLLSYHFHQSVVKNHFLVGLPLFVSFQRRHL